MRIITWIMALLGIALIIANLAFAVFFFKNGNMQGILNAAVIIILVPAVGSALAHLE